MISFRTKNRTKHQPGSLIQGTCHEIFDLLFFSTFQQPFDIFLFHRFLISDKSSSPTPCSVSQHRFFWIFFFTPRDYIFENEIICKIHTRTKISWHCPFKNLTRITTHKNILLFTKALRKSPYVVWVRVLVQYVSYKYFRLMSHLLCPPSDMK